MGEEVLGRRGSQRLAVRSRCEEAMAEAVEGIESKIGTAQDLEN